MPRWTAIQINTILYQAIMYSEYPEGIRVINGSMNMKYDIYPTLSGLELATCSVTSARRFHYVTAPDILSL